MFFGRGPRAPPRTPVLPCPDMLWSPCPGHAGQTPPAGRAKPHSPPRGVTEPAPTPSPFPPLLQCVVPPPQPFSPPFPLSDREVTACPPSISAARDPCHAPKHLTGDGRDRVTAAPPPPPTVRATAMRSLVPLSILAKGLRSLHSLWIAGARRRCLNPPGHLRLIRMPLVAIILAATVDAAAR
jgi:hypothetical protein